MIESGITETDGNRLRIYKIPASQLLAILTRRLPNAIAVPALPQVPPDARLVTVHHDFATRSFFATFSHPSFPLVPDGETIPIVPQTGTVYVQIMLTPEQKKTLIDHGWQPAGLTD